MTASSEIRGSLGSTFWRIRVPPNIVPQMAERMDWNRLGRRVLIDPARGLIAWMAPSSAHERFAAAADRVVDRASERTGLPVVEMRGTRWKHRADDPPNTGIEPDACFYVGDSAERWIEERQNGGQAAALAFEERTPPDLVVEIEWTQIDRGKAERYAEMGVREMWQAERDGDTVAVDILDLQAEGVPVPATRSPLFPGLGKRHIERLLQLAEEKRLAEMEALLGELLAAPVSGPAPETGERLPGTGGRATLPVKAA